MNWDALGAVAELVGAVAFLATIAYLAIRVREKAMPCHWLAGITL